MADKKISALTAATTPLDGTEVLPLVQSGSTVKVANNDLRPKQIQSNATSGVLQIAGPGAAATRVMTTPDANFTAARTDAAQSFTGSQTFTNTSNTQTTMSLVNGTGYNLSTLTNFIIGSENSSSVDGGRTYQWNMGISGTALGKSLTFSTVDTSSGTVERFKATAEGNLAFSSGLGIDFSATSGTGTSELLADYEEGTFTPSITSGASGVSYSTQSGTYTKIGRQVFFRLNLVMSAATANANAFIVGGLPFTAGVQGGGSFSYDNGAWTGSVLISMPMIFVGSAGTEITFFKNSGAQVIGTDLVNIATDNFYIVGQYMV